MFSPLSNGTPGLQDDINRTQGSGGRNHTGGSSSNRGGPAGRLAGSTLRRAGLVDQDSGMRDASRAGPSRRWERAVGSSGENTSSLKRTLDEPVSAARGRSSKLRLARDRANPIGKRHRGSGPVTDSALAGGAASRGGRGAGVKGVALRGSTGKQKLRKAQAGEVARNGSTIETLKSFLTSRWDANSGFLNLSNMASDPILLAAEIKPPGVSGAAKEISNAIWKLAREMFPTITTLSLASNGFKSLVPVMSVPEFLPKLRNLSLQGNDIKWTKDLAAIAPTVSGNSGRRFEELSELVLLENPVQQNAVAAGNEAGYREEVLVKFPSLKMLDMKPVEAVEAQQAASGSKSGSSTQGQASSFVGVAPIPMPLAVKPGFSDESAQAIIPAFLSTFFGHMDTGRQQLKPAYAPKAVMTFTLPLQAPPRARAEGFLFSMKNQRGLHGMTDKLKMLSAHDIMRLGTHSASKGVHSGPDAIVDFMTRQLPKSRHPLSEASKFVVDAWVLPNERIGAVVDTRSEKSSAVLFISVHGEYTELPSEGVRSFDRTFVVAPAAPGSTAANAGWPCVILNEQFTIRQYSGNSAWNPKPVESGSATSASGLTPQQEGEVTRLAAQTGMTLPFAMQCLAQNEWQYEQAVANFASLKQAGQIPPEAFQ
ncbi:NTF2-like protein [Tilletiaria anomala UBC 951]|uniref:mRNA export factor MEX67 n=1 Tax=Tilletiaria anomala (strain ATCC 24038 / CBS 436.72 / UBC 951) TaxID=1037660 RepID=A0A066WQ00_TILAU|nr:NTF2-like protein [Tilletiaria anomala UBC 951]KDN53084.1 NTF2-like protein [Tilletiaria anomala UBC 951]